MNNLIKMVSLFALAVLLGIGIATMLPVTAEAGGCNAVPPFMYCPIECSEPTLILRLVCEGYDRLGIPCNCDTLGCASGCYQT